MIRRVRGNLALFNGEAPPSSTQLERDGYTVLRGVLSVDEIKALTDEIAQAFNDLPVERNRTDRDEFRYAMLNYGPVSQARSAIR